jgi:effector-binding domain-containing protein
VRPPDSQAATLKEAPMACLRQALCAACIAAIFSLAQPLTCLAQTPAVPAPTETPPQAAPAQPLPPAPETPADPFGEEVTLGAQTIVFMKGTATWETALETLIDAFKSINGYLDKQKIKASGQPLAIYTQTDDTGFNYQVGIPVAEPPKNTPRGDLSIGKSPSGKTLKFVHRGSYDSMDTTYEAITNHLDEKRLETEDMFIEEYVTDPVTTAQDKLVVNVYVPLKQ